MITLCVLAFIIASLLYRRRHRHIDMRTVRRLELERYMGRWYEIARYDRPFERRLRNIEARYTLRDVYKRQGMKCRQTSSIAPR